ncbi:MAG: hypothetical protein J5799_01520 [Bacteroidales bacterium]|nr:hypothetical protein [Bacteroidales bacterium]
MPALYIFNPEHDYALAHDSDHFVPLQSAIRFARECAPFLHYLTEKGELLFSPYADTIPDLSATSFTTVRPWGWDRLVRQQLRAAGVDESMLPDDSTLQQLRELAHRSTSIRAMEFLHHECPDLQLPPAARLLTSMDAVAHFIAEEHDCILKSPYSGNGRGNLYVHGDFTPTLQRQSSGVLRRQGALLGEPLYDVVQDFAMEFQCTPQEVQFVGYSLFRTRHYGYAGNELRSDNDIELILAQWIDPKELYSVRNALIKFIVKEIQPNYTGCVGVDMMVFQNSNYKANNSKDWNYVLNPMVEINLRMTMGMAAHILYERHVHPESVGSMQLEYRPARGEMLQYVQAQPEMVCEDGRWREGFLNLTPVNEETQYCITVNIKPLTPHI